MKKVADADSTKVSEQVTYAAGQLRERLGEIDEALPHAGVVQDDDRRALLSWLATIYGDDITETELYRDLVATESTDSLTEAVQHGNVSQMQYAVGLVNGDDDASETNTQAWMRDAVLDEAYVGMVVGGMGTGKTAFAADRADDWHMATRGRVATNVRSLAERNDVPEFVDDWDGLEAFFKEARTDVLFVLDETDQYLSGKGENQQRGDALANALKLVRKGEAPEGTQRGILLVGQSIKGATKELRRLVSMNGHLWRKTAKTTVEVYDDVTSGELDRMHPVKVIQGVQDARWDFHSGEESTFDFDGALDDGDGDQDGNAGELTRDQAIAQVIRAYKPWSDDTGVTMREAGTIVDKSAGWVSDRINEWRGGQHRDLVNDPTA
ncbi:conserved hypothetical protein containing Zot domain [Halorhabdus tiamatea SARL4B]|uniref:Uncharacterized protein n=1 Tax=Halorhabdus tiamatea SARL4B TaxID=1033806 RepID=S6D8Z6_9EURY|nr:conserved hypothetical protein containing Zot domain [Halorhabdus tiamatea SARL4B]